VDSRHFQRELATWFLWQNSGKPPATIEWEWNPWIRAWRGNFVTPGTRFFYLSLVQNHDFATPENPFDPGYLESESLRWLGFRQVGDNARISRSAAIIGLQNIVLGNHVRIDSNVVITAPTGFLKLGNYIHIGSQCSIGCKGGVTFADFSGLSHGVHVYSCNDDYSGHALTNPMIPEHLLNIDIAPIIFEKHVVIGSGSIVLPGVTVGEGTSVGALSLVSKSLESWGIYGGIPARKIRDRSRKLLELEARLIHVDP
jgi:galactoside O-acetyltransferase